MIATSVAAHPGVSTWWETPVNPPAANVTRQAPVSVTSTRIRIGDGVVARQLADAVPGFGVHVVSGAKLSS